MQHYSFDHQFTDGTTVLLIKLTTISLFHGRAPPQAPEVGSPRPLSLASEFCVWRQLCPFPEVHCWPPALPWRQLCLFPCFPPLPRPLRLAPRPLSLAPLNFAPGGNYALFQRSTVGPPAPPPAPRWPQFGYLAEAPRGNYALFDDQSPSPSPRVWPL